MLYDIFWNAFLLKVCSSVSYPHLRILYMNPEPPAFPGRRKAWNREAEEFLSVCIFAGWCSLTTFLAPTALTNKIYKYTNVTWHYFTLQILVSIVSLMHNETEEQKDTYNRRVILQVFCSALVGCGKLQKNIWKDSCCHKDLKSLQLCHQARHAVTW